VNFSKLCRIACVFLFLVFTQGNALAATIHGTVYEWSSFEPLSNVVVKINSTPEQSVVAADSEYSFNLTPGTYQITANYFKGDDLVYTTEENVTISAEGEYVHDLLLFPSYDPGPLNPPGEIPDPVPTKAQFIPGINSQSVLLISAFLASIVFLLGGYVVFTKYKRRPSGDFFEAEDRRINLLQLEGPIKEAEYSEEFENSLTEEDIKVSEAGSNTYSIDNERIPKKSIQPDESIEENLEVSTPLSENELKKSNSSAHPKNHKINLPEDLREILNVIRASGNRITQRELRKKSPYSESKVSLMLSDLEERGLIEKFKRGRGNIIRIPDRHLSKKTEQESKK
jgi:uncharacterized membrane protein